MVSKVSSFQKALNPSGIGAVAPDVRSGMSTGLIPLIVSKGTAFHPFSGQLQITIRLGFIQAQFCSNFFGLPEVFTEFFVKIFSVFIALIQSGSFQIFIKLRIIHGFFESVM